jgi:hypothetical protein
MSVIESVGTLQGMGLNAIPSNAFGVTPSSIILDEKSFTVTSPQEKIYVFTKNVGENKTYRLKLNS